MSRRFNVLDAITILTGLGRQSPGPGWSFPSLCAYWSLVSLCACSEWLLHSPRRRLNTCSLLVATSLVPLGLHNEYAGSSQPDASRGLHAQGRGPGTTRCHSGIRGQTVVFMSADHGGKGKSHGEPTMDEIEIPFIIAGPGIRKGYELRWPVNTYDTAPPLPTCSGSRRPRRGLESGS